MKVRIGIGLGTSLAVSERDALISIVERTEANGFDSAWFAERVGGDMLDPIVAMAVAAARTTRLKFGSSVMVVPGRNPVLLAKAIASLDRVSGGRVLPAFGLGAANLAEHQAFGVTRAERAPWFDEVLPLLRRLWTEDVVDHHGERFQFEGVAVRPHPIQQPLDIWLGGIAPSELARTGRLGDGWLPSFCTPADVAAAIPVIDEHSADAGREPIDREHFGALIGYTPDGSLPEAIADRVRQRRPDLDPEDVFVRGRAGLAARISEFVDAGATKFVLMPFTEPEDWGRELDVLAEATLALQT